MSKQKHNYLELKGKQKLIILMNKKTFFFISLYAFFVFYNAYQFHKVHAFFLLFWTGKQEVSIASIFFKLYFS